MTPADIARLREMCNAWNVSEESPFFTIRRTWVELLDECERLQVAASRAREIAQGLVDEVQVTRAWRTCKGMKPATDASDFCSVPPSGLKRIEWWAKRIIEATEGK